MAVFTSSGFLCHPGKLWISIQLFHYQHPQLPNRYRQVSRTARTGATRRKNAHTHLEAACWPCTRYASNGWYSHSLDVSDYGKEKYGRLYGMCDALYLLEGSSSFVLFVYSRMSCLTLRMRDCCRWVKLLARLGRRPRRQTSLPRFQQGRISRGQRKIVRRGVRSVWMMHVSVTFIHLTDHTHHSSAVWTRGSRYEAHRMYSLVAQGLFGGMFRLRLLFLAC